MLIIKRKFLSALLCGVLLGNSLPVSIVAATEKNPMAITFDDKQSIDELDSAEERYVQYEGTCGGNIIWVLYSDGLLEFSGSGTLEEGSYQWHKSDIKYITINEGITSIAEKAFTGTNNVETVDIADSVESIGWWAFSKCPNLKCITIGKGLKKLGDYCLSYDNSLCKIDVSDENMNFKSVDNILFSFDGKTIYRYPHNGVVEYSIPEGVTEIYDDAFGDIETLTAISFPKTVESIGYYVFDGCSNLKTIYGYTNSVEQAYAKTNNIEFISLGKKAAEGLCGEEDEEGFCKDNARWTLDEGTLTITGMGRITYSSKTTPMWNRYCSLAESLVIKNGVTEIASDMFSYCKSFKEVRIPESTIKIGDNAFYGCENLEKIVFEGDYTTFGIYSVFKDCKFRTAGPLGGGYDYEFGWKTNIPSGAFYGCTDLTSITIPESVTSISAYAFRDCDMDNFTIYGYKNTYAENYAKEKSIRFVSLGEATLNPTDKPNAAASSKPNDSSNTTANSEPANNLNAIADPLAGTLLKDNKKASYKVIEQGKTVVFNKVSNQKVTKVIIPDSVIINGINYKVTGISDNAFSGCKKLNSVTIGKNVTKIGNKAFFKCTSLKKLVIPVNVVKIGKKAFYGCKKLKSIIIKTEKLNNKTVGSQTFKNIYNKVVIKVPKKIKKKYQKWLKKKGIAKTAKIK